MPGNETSPSLSVVVVAMILARVAHQVDRPARLRSQEELVPKSVVVHMAAERDCLELAEVQAAIGLAGGRGHTEALR